jgi:hypothetical protein
VLEKMKENCHIFANSHCAMLLKAIGQSFSIEEYKKTAGKCKCYWIASRQFLKGIGYHWEMPKNTDTHWTNVPIGCV